MQRAAPPGAALRGIQQRRGVRLLGRQQALESGQAKEGFLRNLFTLQPDASRANVKLADWCDYEASLAGVGEPLG